MKLRAWDSIRGGYTESGIWFNNSMMEIQTAPGVVIIKPTGRVSANDKDIFDKDIVIIGRSRAIVRWDNLASRFYLEALDEDNWCDDWDFQDDAERCKVIGSEYETPELMG